MATEVTEEEGELGAAQICGTCPHLQPPPEMAGLQQFSTQIIPKVVQTKASATNQAAASGGSSGHAVGVLGVGWGIRATELKAAGRSGGEQQDQSQAEVKQHHRQQQQDQDKIQQQQQQQQHRQPHLPRPSSAASQALRPSSSRTGGRNSFYLTSRDNSLKLILCIACGVCCLSFA